MAYLPADYVWRHDDVLTQLFNYLDSFRNWWLRLLSTGPALPLIVFNTFLAGLQPATTPEVRIYQNVDTATSYPEHNFSVPIDHFHNDSRYEPHSDGFFNLRYFFDASHYKPGGPVIILQGGEGAANETLPYLQKGIIAQLAQATNGIGVILEHRYYGTSFPTADLSTKNLRFLTTEQALADQAYFHQHIVFPGFEHLNLTAPGTAYIAYGGSYPGGFVAFLRKLYPGSTWGAISSSGVTEAYYDFWQYYEPIRKYGPRDCIDKHTKLTNIADNILLGHNKDTKAQLKAAFQASDFTYDDDFASTLVTPMNSFQSKNWDPELNSSDFDEYCANITSSSILYPNLTSPSTLTSLISSGGWSNSTSTLSTALANLIGWYNTTVLASCSAESTLDDCFSAHNASATKCTDKSFSNSDSLSWSYQQCTEWGYFQAGSSVPSSQLPLLSRLVTLDYASLICKYAFNITSPTNISIINAFGAYNLTYPRLAHIGGEWDPWRPVTPLADPPLDGSTGLLGKQSTLSEPIVLIKGGVHHWDENGVGRNETSKVVPPESVRKAQETIKEVVLAWMKDWREWCKKEGKGVCNNLA